MTAWTWVAASYRGTSHERSGTRLQDALTCVERKGSAPLFLATVSDGAGSAPLGGQGASLVCRNIALLSRKYFDSYGCLPNDTDIGEWLDRTRDLIGAVAHRRALASRDFAATLVCLITSGKETIIAHVGDGCAVIRDAGQSKWIAPSWPDHGEYASTTFFVTDEGGAKLRISRFLGEVDAFAVFSDGLERLALDFKSAQPFEPFFDGLISPVRSSGVIGRDRELSKQLKSYLNSDRINARTDDDKSLILAVRR